MLPTCNIVANRKRSFYFRALTGKDCGYRPTVQAGGSHLMKVLTIKRRIKNSLRMLGAVALLLLYVIGSAQTGYLHQLLHPQEAAATHSSKQEEDPCHRSMYHGVDTGCRHEFHLAKKHSCTFVHTLTPSDSALFDTCHGFFTARYISKVLLPDSLEKVIVTYTFLTRGARSELHV